MSTDGLDALDAKAASARRKTPPPPKSRRVLPPRHPAPAAVPSTAPVRPQETSGALEVPEGQQQFPGLAEAPPGPAVPSPVETPAPQASAPATALPETSQKRDLRKVAVYLDEDTDAALDAIHYAGVTRRPRVDVSKSAVVRLALQRLLAELTSEQVVETIAARPVEGQAPGRKRR